MGPGAGEATPHAAQAAWRGGVDGLHSKAAAADASCVICEYQEKMVGDEGPHRKEAAADASSVICESGSLRRSLVLGGTLAVVRHGHSVGGLASRLLWSAASLGVVYLLVVQA